MRKTREFQVKKEVLVKIGEQVFDDIVTLYREGVGGESHTIQKTVKEVKTLVSEKT